MSYEVTATRRRPQGFEQLIGQDFVVSTLKSSLKLGRIAHAYLFSGPRGVGKTSAARILAKALNCEKGPTPDPCGECSQCQEIARGNSLDVIEIDGASNTSVNDIRELKDEVLFAPNSGRYKVYIIDEVHMLSNSAFNALLKTIEEPPPYIVFVFATTEIHKVPATIRSRCQQFNFRLISMEDIKVQLGQVVGEMGIEAEDEALFWIAKEATGSLRDAYTLFDQVASFSDGSITMKKIQEKLGLTGIDAIGELVDLLADGRGGEAVERAGVILSQGVSIEQLIIDLTEYFRSLLLLKSGVEREGILGYHPERFPVKLRKAFSIPQIEYAVEELLSLYRNIRYSLNQRFEIELMLSKLSSLKDRLSPGEMLEKIRQLKTEIAGAASAGAGSAEPTASPAGGETLSRQTTVPDPESLQSPGSTPGTNTGHTENTPTHRGGSDPSLELSALREQMRAAEKKSPLTGNEAGTQSSHPGPTPAASADGVAPADYAPDTDGPVPKETDFTSSVPGDPGTFSIHSAPTPPGAFTTSGTLDSEMPDTSYLSDSSEETEDPWEDETEPDETGNDEPEVPPDRRPGERRLKPEEVGQIVDGFKQRPSLSSALSQVVSWKLRGRSLEICCDTKYSVRKLQQEIAALKPVAESVLGFPVELNMLMREAYGDSGASGEKKDSQVELVTKVFRGTIIEEAKYEPDGSF
jgi:DNA polymerase-3 subunit gamma/tau